jgi:tetratricopeptide (TPR) repeat protein
MAVMGDPHEPDEQVDLAPEHRKYVLEAYPRLGSLTHYELLGVARHADKKELKRAYFQLVVSVHPDRYLGKKLGSFKPKMAALFARLTEAYETLSVTEKRARYDATLPAATPAAAAVPVARQQEVKRQAALDALKQRFFDAKAKARAHVDTAVRARAAGDFVAATEAYRLALALAPQDTEVAAAFAEMTLAVSAKLAESHRRQALLEERYGHWKEAAASWKRVVDAKPDDEDARQRLAGALAKTNGG